MASLSEGLSLRGQGVVSLVGAGGKTSLMFRMARELSRPGHAVLSTTTTKIFVPTEEQTPHLILSESPDEILRRARGLLKDNHHLTAASGTIPSQGKLAGLPPETIDALWEAGLFRWIVVEADGAAGRPLKAPARHEPVIPGCSGWVVGVIGLDAVGKPLEERWVFRPGLYAGITGLAPGDPVSAESIAELIAHQGGIMKGCPPHARRIVFLNKADLPGGLEAGRRIASLLEEKGRGALERVVVGSALHDPRVMACYDVKQPGGRNGQPLFGAGRAP